MLVGEALRPIRHQVGIATKVVILAERAGNAANQQIRRHLEAPLKRLGVDHVEPHYQHRVSGKGQSRDGLSMRARPSSLAISVVAVRSAETVVSVMIGSGRAITAMYRGMIASGAPSTCRPGA